VKVIVKERILLMLFTLEFIYEIFPDYKGKQPFNANISEVMTDSSEEISNALIIPIVRERFDAQEFINTSDVKEGKAVLYEKSDDLSHTRHNRSTANISTCLCEEGSTNGHWNYWVKW